MPRKFMFTREEITAAALDLTRENGIAAVTARALGDKLGTSSKPIFGLFQNMEEVQQEVIKAAYDLFLNYLKKDMQTDEYPIYKACGMSYIRFAKEEKELFKLLFMCDRSHETIEAHYKKLKPLLEVIQQNTGFSEATAFMLHTEMWVYVHGIATMLAYSFMNWDMEFISKAVTDGYTALKYRHSEEGKGNDGKGGGKS